jgi:hypothetical protein
VPVEVAPRHRPGHEGPRHAREHGRLVTQQQPPRRVVVRDPVQVGGPATPDDDVGLRTHEPLEEEAPHPVVACAAPAEREGRPPGQLGLQVVDPLDQHQLRVLAAGRQQPVEHAQRGQRPAGLVAVQGARDTPARRASPCWLRSAASRAARSAPGTSMPPPWPAHPAGLRGCQQVVDDRSRLGQGGVLGPVAGEVQMSRFLLCQATGSEVDPYPRAATPRRAGARARGRAADSDGPVLRHP